MEQSIILSLNLVTRILHLWGNCQVWVVVVLPFRPIALFLFWYDFFLFYSLFSISFQKSIEKMMPIPKSQVIFLLYLDPLVSGASEFEPGKIWTTCSSPTCVGSIPIHTLFVNYFNH